MTMALLKPIKIDYVLFAMFCGSLAMVAIQWHSSELLGPYQYLIAFGTCATCNLLWLISIRLFRKNNELTRQHYIFAISISLLVIGNYSIDLLVALQRVSEDSIYWLDQLLSKLTTIFSSTVLMLTLAEALNGYSSRSIVEKRQRSLFASGFFIGVFNCLVIANVLIPQSIRSTTFPWFVVTSALLIMCVTYIVILWQYHERRKEPSALKLPSASRTTSAQKLASAPNNNTEELATFKKIETLMQREQLFLEAELKMIDVAQHLKVSEYKISNAIRLHSGSPNFNQFVNAYRIEHAKRLLTSPDAKSSTVLAISLDSGFASIAPFNRAFKTKEGCTPNDFRKRFVVTKPMRADTTS